MNQWDRLPTESEEAGEAFVLWRDAGVDRNASAVARRLQKSRQLLQRWASRHRWNERALAYDREQDRVRQEAAQQAVAAVTHETVTQYELSAQRTLRQA